MESSSRPANSVPPPPAVDDRQSGVLGTALGSAVTLNENGSVDKVVTFGLSSWALARATLVVVAVLLGLYTLSQVQEVLVLLLLAILFATAIEPLVNRLRRGPFSRGQGILVIYSFIFLTLTALGVVFVPGLIGQASDFVTLLPDRIAALRPLVEQMEFRPLRELLLRAIGSAEPAVLLTLDQSGPTAEPAALLNAGGLVLHTLYSVVTVFLLAYYWLTERAAIKRAALRLAPDSRARQINVTWIQVEARLGGWVRGQLLIMLALALMAGVCFLALGLPNPLLLAVLAGLCEMVPLIGPFLAFLPALLVALAYDPFKAALLLPLAVVIQQVEGNVLVPRIMSRTVGISPLTVILGILIGSILYGPAGAFLAVPVAAALQVVFDSTLRPAIEADTTSTSVPTSELEGDASAPGLTRAVSLRSNAGVTPRAS